jgi:hypothetical protein
MTRKKIICADHSGTIVDFEALLTREAAEEYARELREGFNWAQESWGGSHDLRCKKGASPEDFLEGGDKLECEYQGEYFNRYSIKSFEGKRGLYKVEAEYEDEDQPLSEDVSTKKSELFLGKGRAQTGELWVKGRKMGLGDLVDRLL